MKTYPTGFFDSTGNRNFLLDQKMLREERTAVDRNLKIEDDAFVRVLF